MKATLANLTFLVVDGIYLTIRAEFMRRGRNRRKVDKAAFGDRLLILLAFIGQVVLPLVFVFTPWLQRADVSLTPVSLPAGALTMAAGLWLFWRSHADLGNNWSVTLEVDTEHQLVTRCVYRFVRHPMYASFFVLALGQALLLANWIAGWSALAAIAILVVVRLPNEERMMIDHFGDDYRDYMRRTGGLFPRG